MSAFIRLPIAQRPTFWHACLIWLGFLCFGNGSLLSQVCKDPTLIDPNKICTTIYDPVCGCDGVTYPNECEAKYRGGVTTWKLGVCAPSCDQVKADFKWDVPAATPLKVAFFNKSILGAGFLAMTTAWDFGDGTTSTLADPVHEYTKAGTYKVCLKIRALLTPTSATTTCEKSVCYELVVGATNPNPADVCAAACPFQIQYRTQGMTLVATLVSNTPVTSIPPNVTWTLDGQAVGTGIVFTRVFDQPGRRILCAKYPNADPTKDACLSCTAIDIKAATGCVNPALIQANAVCPTTVERVCGCNGETYENACIALKKHGVTAWRSGACNAGSSLCNGLTVNFDAAPTSGTTQWTFKGQVTGLAATLQPKWRWDFGNGQTSDVQNPVVNLPNGEYVVCLSVSVGPNTPNGCTSTFCKKIVVGNSTACVDPALVDPAKVCSTVYAPVCGCDGKTYINECVAKFKNGVKSWTDGPCPGACANPAWKDTAKVCTTQYDPVCGCDGKTYANECVALYKNGITSWKRGPCCTDSCTAVAKFNWQLKAGSTKVIEFKDLSVISAGSTITNWRWFFGDGTNATVQNPVHEYAAPGTYEVCLGIVVRTPGGKVCENKFCLKVEVGSNTACQATAKFDWKLKTGSTKVIEFKDFSVASSGATITNWRWTFGDGTSSTDQNPTHEYAAPGTYEVCLTVLAKTATGLVCENKYCTKVEIASTAACQATAKFDWKLKAGSTKVIEFKDFSAVSAGAAITIWRWTFGDGTTSTDQNPTHEYANPGSYEVCLTIVARTANGAGCENKYCTKVEIATNTACQATARFDWKLKAGSTKVIEFKDFSAVSAGAAITIWRWTFGDGTTSTDQNPTHEYAAAGTYEVCLTVVAKTATGTGCENKYCTKVEIATNTTCQALSKFDWKLKAGSTKVIEFKDLSLVSSGATITTWRWTFGDGTTSTDQNPSHEYAAPGTYEVCLAIVVKTPTGQLCDNKYCAKVEIAGVVACQALAKFDWKLRTGSTKVIEFKDLSLVSSGATITNWRWTFGDGTTSTAQNPSHEYANPGTYEVCLTILVKTPTGQLCDNKFCAKVEIATSADCQALPKFDWKLKAGSTKVIEFKDLSTTSVGGVITVWRWSFGDGTTSSDQNPTHEYAAPGTYEVCLAIVVKTPTGKLCDNKYCAKIEIAPNTPCQAFAKFDWQAQTGDPKTIVFKDASLVSAGTTITNWRWSFGDGTSSTDRNPTHTYTTPGTYEVCLAIRAVSATTAAGVVCEDKICIKVTVLGAGCTDLCAYNINTRVQGFVLYAALSALTPSTTFPAVSWTIDGQSVPSTGIGLVYTFPKPGKYTICAKYPNPDPSKDACLVCKVVEITEVASCENKSLIDTGAVCPTVVERVCGCDGETYVNACVALRKHGITSWRSGRCDSVNRCQNVVLDIQGANTGGALTTWTFKADVFGPILLPGSVKFKWDFGNGATSTDQSPTLNFQQAGQYNVCVTTTLGLGNEVCSRTLCETFEVGAHTPCVDQSLIDPTKACPAIYKPVCGCDGKTYENECVAKYRGGVTSWKDGPCAGASVCRDPSAVDTSKVCPTVSDPVCGCDGQTYQNACVAQYKHGVTSWKRGACCKDTCNLTAKFAWEARPGTGKVIGFKDASSVAGANITNWFWSFGDGKTSTDQNPVHEYATPGIYEVCLGVRAVSPGGKVCENKYCFKITVGNACNLNVKFDWKVSPTNPKLIQFGDLTTPAGLQITNWKWDFGDGTTSTQQNPSHAYAAAGTYKVCLAIRAVSSTGHVCESDLCREVVLANCANDCAYSIAYQLQGTNLYATLQSATPATTPPVDVKWSLNGTPLAFTGPVLIETLEKEGLNVLCCSYAKSNTERCQACVTMIVRPGGASCVDASIPKPAACTAIIDPVCGCNGKQYNNGCEALKQGVTAWRSGACDSASRCERLFVDFDVVASNSTQLKWDFKGKAFFPTNAATFTWNWTYGDNGANGNVQNTDHTYAMPGDYAVGLTVTMTLPGGATCSRTVFKNVSVEYDYCYDPDLLDPSFPCPTLDKPVCGCDGKTYRNKCTAVFHHGIKDWTEGVCGNSCVNPDLADPNKVCPAVLNPVCGCDGKTYQNDCQAQKSGVASWKVGPCCQQLAASCEAYLGAELKGTRKVLLRNKSMNAERWEVSFGDGNTYEGEFLEMEHEYAESGAYEVCLKVGNTDGDCSDKYCTMVDFKSTAAGDLAQTIAVRLQPNPTKDLLRVNLSGAEANHAVLFDLMGRRMFDQAVAGPSFELRLAELPTGIYLLQIDTDKGTVLRKVVRGE